LNTSIDKLSAYAEYEDLKKKKSASAQKEADLNRTPEILKRATPTKVENSIDASIHVIVSF
jgi:hypothetical protein